MKMENLMEIEQIDINKLHIDKKNVRLKIDQNEVNRLADNIREVGILDPIKIDQNNTIIDGNRRYLAAKKVGLKYLPVIRRELNERQKKIEQITHDIMNLPLTPYEKAKAIYDLKNLGLTQNEICKKFGLTSSWVDDIFLVLSDKKAEEIAKSGEVDFFKISESIKGLETKDADRLLSAVRKNPDLTVHKHIRPMRNVMKNKQISEKVKAAMLEGDIEVSEAEKMEDLDEEKQETGVEIVKKLKKNIKYVPSALKKGEVKITKVPENKKKITASQFLDKLKIELLGCVQLMLRVQFILKEMREQDLYQYLSSSQINDAKSVIKELKKSIEPLSSEVDKLKL